MPRWTLTDDQFILRIRRWQRWRRYFGLLGVLLGLAIAAGGYYAVQTLNDRLLAVFNDTRPLPSPTTQDMETMQSALQITLGMKLGFLLSTLMIAGVEIVATGVGALLLRHRKDQLLLQLWDQRPHPDEPAQPR